MGFESTYTFLFKFRSGTYFLSITARGELCQSQALVKEQVECPEWPVLCVLIAQRFEGGPINLRSEVLQQEPTGPFCRAVSAAVASPSVGRA